MMASSVFDEARDVAEVLALLVVERADVRVAQQLAEADDVGQRRAQLVGHVADEGVLHAVGGDERVVALLERALVALGVGDVGEGEQRARRRAAASPHSR